MRPIFLSIVAIALNFVQLSRAADVLHWKCSTASNLWADLPDVAVTDKSPVLSPKTGRIFVDSKRQLQVIDGWGGCFNERGWRAMEALTPAAREELLRNLFDPLGELKLSIGRTPIGASDYATNLYSLDETTNDYAMKNFSIERDQQRLIPYIKAALAVRPDLELWAVPWSPPSWMKTSDSLVGGSIKDDWQTLDALALYFVRYVLAYKDAGVTIHTVMPQNEPSIASNYSSCLWTSEQLAKFIGHHLGPIFRKQKITAQIWLGTLQDSDRGGYNYWGAPSLQDLNVRQFINGLGCQWSADETMAETHFLFPDLKLWQTEAECGTTNSNDWAFGEKQFELAKKWFSAGANANIIWNLVLDETGFSTAHWAQCSPVVVNSQTKTVTYTPYYYCYRHFSHFIQPGAHVIATAGTWSNTVAFVNPNGQIVVVLQNSTDNAATIALILHGKQSAPCSLPAHSFNTFTFAEK